MLTFQGVRLWKRKHIYNPLYPVNLGIYSDIYIIFISRIFGNFPGFSFYAFQFESSLSSQNFKIHFFIFIYSRAPRFFYIYSSCILNFQIKSQHFLRGKYQSVKRSVNSKLNWNALRFAG